MEIPNAGHLMGTPFKRKGGCQPPEKEPVEHYILNVPSVRPRILPLKQFGRLTQILFVY